MLIKAIFLFLIKIAIAVTSFLPDHTAIEWPDTGPLFDMVGGLASVDYYISVPIFFSVVAVILAFEVGMWLYAAWRALLGLIPALK